MNQIPAQFFQQLIARLKTDKPRFYRIIQTYAIYAPVASWGLTWLVSTALPGMGGTIPKWLDFAYSQVLAFNMLITGLGLGGAFVAQTTIVTPSTPELATAPTKADKEQEVLTLLQEMRSELDELKRPKATTL
jgi:hypothetical protein